MPTSSSARWTLIVVLLAPAVVLPLLVPLYDAEDPTLLGFPFYYWFPLGMIPVALGDEGVQAELTPDVAKH